MKVPRKIRLDRLGITHQLPKEGSRLTRIQLKIIEHNLEHLSQGSLYDATGEFKLENVLKKSGLEDWLQIMENMIEKIEEEREW